MTALTGRRVLVVEDEPLIGLMLAEFLQESGAIVAGPAASVGDGLALIGAGGIDCGILDVNLAGQPVDPLASDLAARGVPFVFATGYGRAPQGTWDGVPVVEKPYSFDDLLAVLTRLLQRARV